MKKNITINLFGTLYAIDEDAYELLKKYLDNMRSYFRSKEGGEEIADDIEHRVAELMSEMKAEGMEAVNIEHVENIIHRIGNPEEMDEKEAEENSDDGTTTENTGRRLHSWLKGRKLFRDGEDTMIGGVMSGLCHYFGGNDPLPWRIGIVLLCIFSVFSFSTLVIIYLLLWAFVPQACTAEQRLQMQGREVNTSTLNEEIMRGADAAREFVTNPSVQAKARSFMGTVISILVFCIKAVFLFVCCALLIPLLVGISFVLYATVRGTQALIEAGIDWQFIKTIEATPGSMWQLWVVLISALCSAFILIYACFRWMNNRNDEHRMKTSTRTTLFFTWLACTTIAITMSVLIHIETENAAYSLEAQMNTHNGIHLNRESWKFLNSEGWKVVTMKNCNKSVFEYCEDPYTGEYREYLCLNNYYMAEGKMRYTLEQETEAAPGLYRLEAIAMSHAKGYCIYLASGTKQPVVAQVPNTPRKNHGNIFSMTWEEAKQIAYFASVTDSASWEPIRASCDSWNYVATDTLHHPGGPLRYGISNDDSFTLVPSSNGEASLLEIVLTRLDEEL